MVFRWLKNLFSSAQEGEDTPVVIFTATPVRRDETPPPHMAGDWDSLPSAEKIRRVPIAPLPFAQGALIEDAGSRSKKTFEVRVTQQLPGKFEMNDQTAITVFVKARGREAALAMVAEKICGRPGWLEDSKAKAATCGRWYEGNMTRLEIVGPVSPQASTTSS